MRYLDLLKKNILNEIYLETEARIALLATTAYCDLPITSDEIIRSLLRITSHDFFRIIKSQKQTGGFLQIQLINANGQAEERMELRNFTFTAHTMIGRARLDQLHACLDTIVADKIDGDFIETGVWKGGATIFMRGYLAIHGITGRRVWLADSFQGLPKPSREQDSKYDFSANVFPYLSVSLEVVKTLFERYNLLDDQVCFLKGWFKDTLPSAPIERLALLRLDGDLYESTMDTLRALYDKVSAGGFIIIDDYFAFPGCREAVDEFRSSREIDSQLVTIDEAAVYWRKGHAQ